MAAAAAEEDDGRVVAPRLLPVVVVDSRTAKCELIHLGAFQLR